MRNTARSSGKPCLREPARSSITLRQPVSSHNRWKTRAGPIRRAAFAVTAPSATALTTMAFAAKRAPDRSNRSQLAAVAQILDAAERGDHLLAHLRAVAAAFDDLEIGAAARGSGNTCAEPSEPTYSVVRT